MKRFTAVFLTLTLFASLAACSGKPTDGTNPDKTTEAATEIISRETKTQYVPDRSAFTDPDASDTAELMESYYKARFNAAESGHILRDINGDDQTEMLVFVRVAAKNGSADATALYYLKAEKNKVVVSDVVVQQDRLNEARADDIYDETAYGDYRGEAQEAFLSSENYICISRFLCDKAWRADYIVYQIQNDKFKWVKGINDPGHTRGVGLYMDEDGSDHENKTLYRIDAFGEKSGDYDSYEQAITSELEPLGFKLYKNGEDGRGGSGKYQISETEDAVKFYGFSLYANT